MTLTDLTMTMTRRLKQPIRRSLARLAWVLLVACAPLAAADAVRLATGEVLIVSNVVETGSTVQFTHPVLGTLVLPRENVTVLPPVTAIPPDEAEARAKAKEEALTRVDREFEQRKTEQSEKARLNTASFFEGWKGSLELGANGANGNSDSLSVRGGARAARISQVMETRAAITYTYATDNGTASQNRGEAGILNDWLFENSPWGLFAKGLAEYDEFQDWDWRLSAFAGPSYSFFKTDRFTLRGRLGAGVTREIGGTRNELIPEGLAGVDITYKITEHQSMFTTAEFLPSLSSFPDYRVNVTAGYKIIIDPQSKLSLNLGAQEQYDSNPGEGFDPNDIEYFALLGLDF